MCFMVGYSDENGWYWLGCSPFDVPGVGGEESSNTFGVLQFPAL
jgi:hypothetical protein